MQRVTARAGRTYGSATLEALPRFLVIESEPAGASVLLAGRDRGRTPARIRLDGVPGAAPAAPLAPIDLRLVKSGYQDFQTTVAPDQDWVEEGGMLTHTVRAALAPAAVAAAATAPP